MNIFKTLGGRKLVFILAAMIVIALNNILQLSQKEIEYIVYLALGGAGTIALEDSVKHIAKRKKG